MFFQNKNPHDESIIDPTSNSEYSNKNISISLENSKPSSSQEPENDLLLLCKQKKKHHNRLFSSNLNVNSILNKIVDILVITGSKLDQFFPGSQFFIIRFSKSFRKDRNRHGGGLLMNIKKDILQKIQKLSFNLPSDIEKIITELNINKIKWLVFGCYHPPFQSD